MANKANSLTHTKWLCNTILYSPPSIEEKLFIINIEQVYKRLSKDCAVIKV
ncbi:hypothetical protein TEHMS4_03460 [Tetragenococcus halophilus]|nr:hypothetical protein TEHIT2_20380 [Tetragenococcus halophilus]GMG67412.1 hypothetical protein TEHMS4_03460 [Tetragenococcus halophilus]